ncbi:MAG: bifunctional hydroxymethylpyrimidine kinase/phosphomethylpyrimidine kinase, partial [Geminicoccaceae bacterium]
MMVEDSHRTGKTANVLTIAGSDSGGGAGIQADLKTMSALGVYGLSVITALTAQNTMAVTAIHDVPPDMIAAQLDAFFDDIRIDAVKICMLSRPEVI